MFRTNNSVLFKPSTHNENNGFINFSKKYKPTQEYDPIGDEWDNLNNVWTVTSQAQLYNIKNIIFRLKKSE